MKTIQIVPLINYSTGYEETRILNVSREILDNKTDELKELLRKRLDDLFNNDIESYFDVDVTEEFEECVSELAQVHDANIQGERFWWGEIEDVVI